MNNRESNDNNTMNENNKKPENKEDKITVEKIIKEVDGEVIYFCSTRGEPFLRKKNEFGVQFIIPIDNEVMFEQWFRSVCYDRYQLIVTSGSCSHAQKHFKMQALRKGEKEVIYRRTAKIGGAIYYNLLDEDRRVLKITKSDMKYVKNPKPIFVHDEKSASQVIPDLNMEAESVLDYVRKYFNIKGSQDEILLSAFLISCFWANDIQHPLLQVYGQKGAAKSSCLEYIQSLIDPQETDLYQFRNKEEDVAICLHSNFMVCFDNISRISEEISNMFCQSCTGGTRATRKLHTNGELFLLDLRAIVCFNGVSQNVMKSDLADRTLFLQLYRMKEKEMKSPNEMKAEWKKDRPKFLGALCAAVKNILADNEPIKCASPIRLNGFYKIAVKAGRQLGFIEEEVYQAFKENKRTINDTIISEDMVLTVIYEMMSRKEYNSGENIKLTVTDFYKKLKLFAFEEFAVDGYNYPRSASLLSRRLNENKSNLEELGIYFEIRRGKNARYIEMWKQK